MGSTDQPNGWLLKTVLACLLSALLSGAGGSTLTMIFGPWPTRHEMSETVEEGVAKAILNHERQGRHPDAASTDSVASMKESVDQISGALKVVGQSVQSSSIALAELKVELRHIREQLGDDP